ncbi:MAG: dienelactone hydrolase family protein [Pseudomonadales bacterium]
MCDEHTVNDTDAFLRRQAMLSRRSFNTLTAVAAAAVLLPAPADAADVTEVDVSVPTPDGTADCYFAHPSRGRHPGVIVWPDVVGLRPAFRLMGRRLAQSGYSVLVVNPYYRSATAPVVPEGASFQDPATREILMPLARSLSAATHATDARAFVEYLDQQESVDSTRKMGTTGYCMGGPITLRTAATMPERIGATASFHGARLVTDGDDSPHLLVGQMRASALIAIAENDDEREPDAKNVLRAAFDQAGLPAEIEVYAGAMHGWCPPDSRVYNEAQAEHAWSRLLALFAGALT